MSRHDVDSEGLKAVTQAYLDLKYVKINKNEYNTKMEEIQSGKYRPTFESTTSLLSNIGNGILGIGSAIGNGFVNLGSGIGNGIVSIGSGIILL